jgi:hypothetical protein
MSANVNSLQTTQHRTTAAHEEAAGAIAAHDCSRPLKNSRLRTSFRELANAGMSGLKRIPAEFTTPLAILPESFDSSAAATASGQTVGRTDRAAWGQGVEAVAEKDEHGDAHPGPCPRNVSFSVPLPSDSTRV